MNMLTSLKALLFAAPAGKSVKTDIAAPGSAGDFAQLLNAVATPPVAEGTNRPVDMPPAGTAAVAADAEPAPATAQAWTPPALISPPAISTDPAIAQAGGEKGDQTVHLAVRTVDDGPDVPHSPAIAARPFVDAPDEAMASFDAAPLSALQEQSAPMPAQVMQVGEADATPDTIASAAAMDQAPARATSRPAPGRPALRPLDVNQSAATMPAAISTVETSEAQDTETQSYEAEDGAPVTRDAMPDAMQAATLAMTPSPAIVSPATDIRLEASQPASDRHTSGSGVSVTAAAPTAVETKAVSTAPDPAPAATFSDRLMTTGELRPEQMERPQAATSSPAQAVTAVAPRSDAATPIAPVDAGGQPIPLPVPPPVSQAAPVGVSAALPSTPDTALILPQATDVPQEAAPAVVATPARAEAVSLLQLVRDHMSLRAPREVDATASVPSHVRDAATDALEVALPVAVNDTAPPLVPSIQTVAPSFATSAMAIPTVDLSASLGAQVVDMGVSGQWIDGLARDIAGLSANGAQGRFQINADQLGPIQVDIRQGDDGAAISLTVATEAAERALRQDSDLLKQDMALTPVRISDVKIERASHVTETVRADTAQTTSQQQQGQNSGQAAGQGMGQSSAQSHMQGRGQQRENIPFGHKVGSDAVVLNHMDGGDSADGAVRARYA